MESKTVRTRVNDYIERARSVLPETFETEDLLEDVRAHIYDSLQHKMNKRPDGDAELLLDEVFREIGEPEDIAEAFGEQKIGTEEEENGQENWKTLANILIKVVVVILAAWVVNQITNGAVDFFLAVIVLFFFVVLEWLLRDWEMKRAK